MECFCFMLQLVVCSFLMRHRKGVDPHSRGGGEELGELEGGETNQDILYENRSIFNKREKENINVFL